jgi:hypothetical protein
VAGVGEEKLPARGIDGGGRGGSGKTARRALCWAISELRRFTGV